MPNLALNLELDLTIAQRARPSYCARAPDGACYQTRNPIQLG